MKVRVQLYPDVRKTSPYGLTYRPHFVVKGTELYLGIQFDSLQEMPLGTQIDAEVRVYIQSIIQGLLPGQSFILWKDLTRLVKVLFYRSSVLLLKV